LIFKELDREQTVVCCVALLSAQKRNYDLLLKPCQAVDLSASFRRLLIDFILPAFSETFKS
jgi:hypothetical protein